MPDYEPLLNRWQSAGVLDAEAAARIRAWESAQSATTAARVSEPRTETPGRWGRMAGPRRAHSRWHSSGQRHRPLRLGPLGSARPRHALSAGDGDGHASFISPAPLPRKVPATSTMLHAVGTISTGAAIALVGQIFNIQEHWPAAILMWAIAALLRLDAAARPGPADTDFVALSRMAHL